MGRTRCSQETLGREVKPLFSLLLICLDSLFCFVLFFCNLPVSLPFFLPIIIKRLPCLNVDLQASSSASIFCLDHFISLSQLHQVIMMLSLTEYSTLQCYHPETHITKICFVDNATSPFKSISSRIFGGCLVSLEGLRSGLL